jgi:hypothetical protein
LVVVSLDSCINEPCVKPPQSTLKLQLFTKNREGGDSVLRNVQLMYKTNAGGSQWLQFTARGVEELLPLPVSRATERTSYVFAAFNADTMVWFDTMHIQYSRNLAFISEPCGFEYFFQIRGLQTSLFAIDSVVLVRNIADTSTLPNVKIYLP